MAIGSLEGNYSTLLVAPNSMKSKIIELIDREISKGTKGRIFVKFESLKVCSSSYHAIFVIQRYPRTELI